MHLKSFWIYYTDNVNHRKVETCLAASAEDAKNSFIYTNELSGNKVEIEKVVPKKENHAS